MKSLLLSTFVLTSLIALPALSAAPSLIPAPKAMQVSKGKLTLEGTISYHCPAKFKQSLLIGLDRLELKESKNASIIVKENKNLSKREAYTLEITPKGIAIGAKSPAGVFYATQTLLQLMPADVFKKTARPNSITLPTVKIQDAPRFAWRGLMLDSSRHFQTIEEVRRFIDLMAIHKLNVFHWHLTDGHGWRFESKKYPNLTKKGAWRMQPGYPEKGKTERYGGFYTQQEMKDLVAYAKARNITIVPEIDMPGHCFAFVAAYPKLGCLGHPQETDRLYTYPADAQRFPSIKGTDVLCVGQKETLKVCKEILDEVMEIFPSKFIHIGGDEVQKRFWKNCKTCQAHIKKNKLHGEHGLQSWFIQQLDNHITSRGRRLIGWDEILEGGLAKNATVMSWQGEQGGIKAAKMGHDVVMSPQTYIYLDHGQSHSPLEPAHWPGHKPLDRAYNYDPIPKSLSPKEAQHILGVQGNVWTVFVHEEWLLDLVTWPRAAAIAEVGWSPKSARNWDNFYQRLSQTHRQRLDNLGVNYWWENSAELGAWNPGQMKPDDEPVTLEYDITQKIKHLPEGKFDVTFTYTKGGHGLTILSAEILENGRSISKESHKGFTGVKHTKNVYPLQFPKQKDGAKYTLKVQAYGDGGTDSTGVVNLFSVETKRIK